MARKRLVLCLLLDRGIFVNSRRFELSNVGNVETILAYLNFEAMDEVVLLNVSRGEKRLKEFAGHLEELARHCFVPMTVGGGVRSLEDFDTLLRSGADKVVLNTAAVEEPALVTAASRRFGSQCVVVSIDVRGREGRRTVCIRDGTRATGLEPVAWAREVEALGAGEIFLTSIDRDGTCQGYDLELVRAVAGAVDIPVVASGGVGELDHLPEGIRQGGADAVAAANIFHFIGEGLVKAKETLRGAGLDVPRLWTF